MECDQRCKLESEGSSVVQLNISWCAHEVYSLFWISCWQYPWHANCLVIKLDQPSQWKKTLKNSQMNVPRWIFNHNIHLVLMQSHHMASEDFVTVQKSYRQLLWYSCGAFGSFLKLVCFLCIVQNQNVSFWVPWFCIWDQKRIWDLT